MSNRYPYPGNRSAIAPRSAGLVVLLMVVAVALPATAGAQATIYRCHALDGQLIFQDRPCDQVAGTQEARRGSAGEIVPNAPPAPAVEGPPLVERYENYLDNQAARRAAEAAATAAAAPAQSFGVGRAAASGGVTATGPVEAYSGYSDGEYPGYAGYPVYPPYRYRDRPGNNGGTRVPPYDNSPGPQALPKPTPLPTILPAPGLTLSPPNTPRPSTPGHVVARDPNR